MKRIAAIVSAVVIVTAILGCATTGEIPVALETDEAIYISPANGDGVQDTVTYDLAVTPLERTRIVRYEVSVVDADGTTVSVRTETVDPPEIVLWDGRDDNGELVPDGSYRLSVAVWDNHENTGAGGPHEIIVDNTVPAVAVSTPYTLFTPDGDDRLDVLSVYQRGSTHEDLWTGEMIDEDGTTVRTFTWQGGARDFTWDGTTDQESVAAEGTYTYRVSATDRAGNTGVYETGGIVLERDPRPATLSVERRAFSPNGDGRADTIGITPEIEVTENLASWRIDITDVAGTVVESATGTGVPTTFRYDGLDDQGKPVPDGPYRAVLSLGYAGGQTVETSSSPFEVDTAPPQGTVRVNTAAFSPDGDGSRDTVTFLQSSSEEEEWEGILTAPSEEVVLRRVWHGRVEDFSWDGTDADGDVLPDGVYTYTLRAEDEAENESRPIVTRVRLDTRPTPVRISADETVFSPNGDGVRDTVTLETGVMVAGEIERWEVRILDTTGSTRGRIAYGIELPESVTWDGRVGDGAIADGEYVAEFEVGFANGNLETGRSGTIRVDTTPPSVSASIDPPLFSPDGDGVNDTLEISLEASDVSSVTRWQAELFDPAGDIFMSWSGAGTPRTLIRWNGRSESGELVRSAEDYELVVTATDSVSNDGSTTVPVPVDILVIRQGDSLRIRISNVYFVAYKTDYVGLDPAAAQRNVETLDRLAAILEKYPQHTVRIEGHAVQVYWDDPARAEAEQREVLLPLSLERAETIKKALVRRGIESHRITTAGYGGESPVVPHSDMENRWKNRRVEFILERR